MGLIETIKRSFSATSRAFFFERLGGSDGSAVSNAYSEHAWTYAAINKIASSVSSVECLAYVGKKRGKESKPLNEQDPIAQFLARPNRSMSAAQVWEMTVIYMTLTPGRCIWLLAGRAGRLGPKDVPYEAVPLPGNGWTPLDKDQRPLCDSTSKIAFWQFNGLTFGAHEVLVFDRLNPSSVSDSMSPLIPARAAIDAAYAAETANAASWKNGGQPGGWITIERMLTPDQLKQFKHGWEAEHGGPLNRGKTAILQNGATFTPNPRTPQDMEYIEGLRWTRDEVLACLGVPKAVLSITDDLNYATHIGQVRVFWETTILPLLGRLSGVIDIQLLARVGFDGYAAFDVANVAALQSDFSEKLSQASTLVSLGYDLDQVNERLNLGMPKAPVVDDALLSALKDMSGQTIEASVPRSFNVRRSMSFVKDKRAWIDHHIRATIFPLEARFSQTMRRYLRALSENQRKRFERWILEANLKDGDVFTLTQNEIEKILFAEQRWNDVLKNTFSDEYERIIKRNLNLVAKEMDTVVIPATDPRILQLHGALLGKLVQVNATTRKQIRSDLIKSVADGDTVGETQGRLLARGNMQASRALLIARTETGMAASATRFGAFEEYGVTKHEWLSSNDSHVRDSHQDVDEEVRPIGEKFSNGLRYPHELGAPPSEVCNCRCDAVAVE